MINLLCLRMFNPVIPSESIEDRHNYLLRELSKIDPPLGLDGIDTKDLKMPSTEKDIVHVIYKHPETKGVSQIYWYSHRTPTIRWEEDTYSFGIDRILYEFKPNYKKISFQDIIYSNFPQVIEINKPRVAENYYSRYSICYEYGHTPNEPTPVDKHGLPISPVPAYNNLEVRGITPNGRNNIYTLSPACYWNNDLCQTALGYDRDEVIRRLAGMVLDIRPLADGVYIVFNDNPLLSFDDFLTIQHTFKPILGLQ